MAKSKYIRITHIQNPKGNPQSGDERPIKTALNEKDSKLREKAVERLTDPSVLEMIALNDPNQFVRAKAIRKVTDPDTPRRAALNDKKEIVNLRAVARIDGEATLKEIIENTPFPKVSKTAKMRLLPPEALMEMIYNEYESGGTRRIAVECLSDRSLLRRVAATGPEKGFCRQVAKLKLKYLAADGVNLEEFPDFAGTEALKNPDPLVRIEAVKRLNDCDILKEIASWDKDADVRLAATERLADQNFLAVGPLRDPESRVRLAALARITDPEVIIRAALSDWNHLIQNAALRKVDSNRQDIFLKSASEDNEPDNFRLAIERLSDRESLQKILYSHPDWRRRIEVLKKINDPEELKRAETENDSPNVCFFAAERRSENDPDAAVETFIRLIRNPDTPFESALRIADLLRERYKKSGGKKIRSDISSLSGTEFQFIVRTGPGDFLHPVQITAVKSFRFHLRGSVIKPVDVLTDPQTLKSPARDNPDSLSFLNAVRSQITPDQSPKEKKNRRDRYRPRLKYPED